MTPTGGKGRGYVPLLVMIYLGFLEYAYSYLLCHLQISIHLGKPAVAIVLIVIFNIILFILFTVWLILLLSPIDEIPFQVKPYDLAKYVAAGQKINSGCTILSADSMKENETGSHLGTNDVKQFTEPPDLFPCSIDGLPAWCFDCHTIKALRSSHSSKTGKCVPKLDHDCLFIGTLIAKHNFPYFMVYVAAMWGLFLITIVTLAVYTSRIRDFHNLHNIHPAFIVSYIICGIWLVLLCNLLSTIVMLSCTNETTLDVMKKKRLNKQFRQQWKNHVGGSIGLIRSSFSIQKLKQKEEFIQSLEDPKRKYFNVLHPSNHNLRYIVKADISDFPYNNGLLANLKEIFHRKKFKNVEEILLYESECISNNFKEKCYHKIENGDAVIFGSRNVNLVPT